MAFFEQQFPARISADAVGGPVWKTEEVRLPNGVRMTNGLALYALHEYELQQAVDSADRFEIVRAFVYVVGGRRDGFRFQAPDDHACAAAESSATLVTGSVYQLNKLYTAFSRTYIRPIYKPVPAGFLFFRTRSEVTTDITGSSTLDTTTGRVTVTGHMSGDTYTWSGEFDIPVSFESDTAAFRFIGTSKLYTEWPSLRVIEYRLPGL